VFEFPAKQYAPYSVEW